MDPLLFFTVPLLLPVVVFVALSLVRRARFRVLAEKLRARHEGIHPFTPGAVVGEGFRIQASRVHKTYRTSIEVRSPRARGRFQLEVEFFSGAPNWSHARAPGSRTERVFLWEVQLPAFVQPTREQREVLLEWLPRPAELEALHTELKAAAVRAIEVTDGMVSISFPGIVSDPPRIQRALEALRRLATVTPADRRSTERAA
jgi:hypothetical protein